MAKRAKRDFNKGVYRLLYEYENLNKFDVVLTYALNNDPEGKGFNEDIVLAKEIEWKDLKSVIRKHNIKRALWFGNGEDDYVIPKDVISGECMCVFVMPGSVWG